MAAAAEPVSRRDRPAKPPLTRRSILDAATALIRERGVDSVSLRAVAEQVQTGPASLYAYFANRDVLLENVLDEAYQRVELPAVRDGDWRGALASAIANTVEVLGEYPGLGSVALGSIPTLPGALRIADHELDLMATGGVAPARAALAVDVIAQFVAATATERTMRSVPFGPEERTRLHGIYQAADPDRFPHVVEAADALTAPSERARRDFAIEVIIAGLASTRP